MDYLFESKTKIVNLHNQNNGESVNLILAYYFMSYFRSKSPESSVELTRLSSFDKTKEDSDVLLEYYYLIWKDVTAHNRDYYKKEFSLLNRFIQDLENPDIRFVMSSEKRELVCKNNDKKSLYVSKLVSLEMDLNEQLETVTKSLSSFEFEKAGFSKEVIDIALGTLLLKIEGTKDYEDFYHIILSYLQNKTEWISWTPSYTLNMAYLALMSNPHLHHPDAHYFDLYETGKKYISEIGKVPENLLHLAKKQQEVMKNISNSWKESGGTVGAIVAEIQNRGGEIYESCN